MTEIAQATYTHEDFTLIMDTIYKRVCVFYFFIFLFFVFMYLLPPLIPF